MNFEASTVVMFQVKIFWVVMPRNIMVGYQHFGGPQCLQLEHLYPTMTLHSVTTQKTLTCFSVL